MATGLERILEQIRADAEQKAGETVAAAEREAEAECEIHTLGRKLPF